jgi:hypothetical protein
MSKSRFLAGAVAGVALSLSSAGALAGGVATSLVEVSDFIFVNADTGEKIRLGVGSDDAQADFYFEGNGVSNTGDTDATLNGVSIGNGIDAPVDGSGVFDVDHACLGACTYVENSFATVADGADAASTYVVGDVLFTGSSVNVTDDFASDNGLPSSNLPDGVGTTLAEVSLTGEGSGTSAGNNVGATGSFTFVAGADMDIRVDFVIDVFLRAFLSNSVQGTLATSSFVFNVKVSEDGVNCGGDFQPACPLDLGLTSSVGVSEAGDDSVLDVTSVNGGLTDAQRTFSVTGGETYQITILQQSNANATVVPAPGSLALMGLGQLGLASYKRRRKAA